MSESELLAQARTAAIQAYCPYSRFQVGAAILMDGDVFVGCNVENASYGLSMCAERTAIFQAVSRGKRRLQAVAVSCITASVEGPITNRTPCGACRQVIREFADQQTRITIDGVGTYSIDELLPMGFQLRPGPA